LNVLGAEKFVLERLDAAGPLSVDIKNATITLATASATGELQNGNIEVPELGLTITGNGNIA